MRTLRVAAAAAGLFGSVLLALGTIEAQSAALVPGFMDPATGTFTVRPALVPSVAALTRTGAITVTTTLQIDSQIPADQTISCTVTVSSFDSAANNNAMGSNNVIRTGNLGKCTTTIHYIWLVASPATLMNVSVGVSTGNSFGGGISHGAGLSFSPFPVPNTAKSLTANLAL
jgi:hypothetical protein